MKVERLETAAYLVPAADQLMGSYRDVGEGFGGWREDHAFLLQQRGRHLIAVAHHLMNPAVAALTREVNQ